MPSNSDSGQDPPQDQPTGDAVSRSGAAAAAPARAHDSGQDPPNEQPGPATGKAVKRGQDPPQEQPV